MIFRSQRKLPTIQPDCELIFDRRYNGCAGGLLLLVGKDSFFLSDSILRKTPILMIADLAILILFGLWIVFTNFLSGKRMKNRKMIDFAKTSVYNRINKSLMGTVTALRNRQRGMPPAESIPEDETVNTTPERPLIGSGYAPLQAR